jgi:hypothetical protein
MPGPSYPFDQHEHLCHTETAQCLDGPSPLLRIAVSGLPYLIDRDARKGV